MGQHLNAQGSDCKALPINCGFGEDETIPKGKSDPVWTNQFSFPEQKLSNK